MAIGSLFENNQYRELTRELTVVPLAYRTFSFRGSNDQPAYAKLLEDFRPDVIHTHRFLAEFLSAHHVSEDVAYVCHGHDNMVQFARFRPGAVLRRTALTNWLEKRYLIRMKYRRVRTAFVANSNHTYRYFRAVLPRSMRDDVRLLPYGFDHRRFRARGTRTPPGREPLRLVNVGSFQDKKNQVFIVEIARVLRDSGVEFRIDLLGDGATRPRVEAEVERHGLGDRILLHGNVDRPEDWLRRSHVYLHTARYEPFGLVLLEAMAAGLPCVVLDGMGNRDVIEEGANGYLIPREDASVFAERIRTLASSPDLYRRMSDRARTYASGWDIGEAADRFVALYRELLAERRR